MSCEQYREKMFDVLADGATALSVEISAHLGICAGCREFYEEQRSLLAAVDAGVRAMVNEEAPASLLPMVRARIEEAPTRRKTWHPAWGMAVAAAVILAIGLGMIRHSQEQNGQWTEVVRVPSPDSAAIVTTPGASGMEQRAEQKKQSVPRKAMARNLVPSSQVAEVMVLVDEREAYATFVARLPEERAAAAGLVRPAAQQEGPVEIALLQIKELEVDPLERSEAK